MPSPRRNNEGLLARVNFPLYTLQMLTSRHVIVGGGGGSSKTGVANGFEIFELSHDGKRFIVEEMVRHETGSVVVMNCACYSNSKRTFLVAGQESHCQLYNVSFDIVNRRRTTSVSSNDPHQVGETNLRRRGSRVRGTSVSEDHPSVTKEKDKEKEKVNKNSNEFRHLEFHIKPVDSVQTDFSKQEPLQKVVRISRSGEFMATGGTDGHVRIWRFSSLKSVYTLKGHSKEVDDLDFSPDCKMLVSISKDGQALVWNVKTGKKLQSMIWPTPNGTKYVYKRCRFGWKEEDDTSCRLFLISNPVNRVGKQVAYIQLWDPIEGQLKKSSIIEESLSALAVRDDGRFVAVGTMFSGSVYIYIAFSLQQVLCVHDAHGMFVTGLEFLPAISEDATITTMSEAAVISISVDNRICIHNLPYRRTLPPWLVIVLIIVTLFLTFVFCSYIGL